MSDSDPLDYPWGKKLGQFASFLIDAFSERVSVDDKLSKLTEISGEPFDETHDERIDLVDLDFARSEFQKMWPLHLYFRPEILGVENIPESGGAVLVSNHVVMAVDTMILNMLVFEKTKRLIRPTVDKVMIRLPWFRNWALKMGCVAGLRDNALRLAQAGELVLSYPGGAREALKRSKDAYRLMWDGATGFARVAVRAGVPIVPIASVGGDESYETFGEDTGLASQFTGLARYAMPLYLGLGPLPLPVKFLFSVGKPIHPDLPPEKADDEAVMKEVRAHVQRELEKLLDETRLRRGVSAF